LPTPTLVVTPYNEIKQAIFDTLILNGDGLRILTGNRPSHWCPGYEKMMRFYFIKLNQGIQSHFGFCMIMVSYQMPQTRLREPGRKPDKLKC
jgi:hypothetical protein